MLLQLVNPNSTTAMTQAIGRQARRVANPGTRILAQCPPDTPASIEGHADEALSVPAMLALIREGRALGAGAHVVACFDDPGLDAAREEAAAPVVGLCHAAVTVAMATTRRFSVVTTLGRSVPILEDLVDRYGAARQCRRVRAVELPVLALDEDPAHAETALEAAIRTARAEDAAEAIVLGCAGMADMAARLAARTGVPVIDGVAAAVKLAEALAAGGFTTSKLGAYADPRPKRGRPAAPVAVCPG